MKKLRNALLISTPLFLVGAAAAQAQGTNIEALCRALEQGTAETVQTAELSNQAQQEADRAMSEVRSLVQKGAYGDCVAQLREVRTVLERENVDVSALLVIEQEQLAMAGGDDKRTTKMEVEGGGEIVVEQEAPDVEVEQSAPQVAVSQRQPEVLVTQPQPEIIVRQPEPEVTVQVPQPEVTVVQAQPEIIVRIPEPIVQIQLPEPEVDVDQQRPTVNVQQPQPQISFVQPEPRVSFEQAEPNISYEQAEADVQVTEATGLEESIRIEQEEPEISVQQQGEPDVNIQQQGQAEVNIREEGEPEIEVQQSEAQVEIEEVDVEDQQAAAGQRTDEDGVAVGAAVEGTGEQADPVRERMENHQLAAFRADSLEGLDVYGSNGDVIGEVETVAQRERELFLIVSEGGFLGMGDQEIPLAFDNFAVEGNRIVLKNMTEEQFEEQFDDVDWDENDYEALNGNRTVRDLYVERL